jgi:hypothetical protein
MDQVEFSGRLIYELRFIDSLGREQVLATRNISVEIIEGHPSGEIAPGFSLPVGLAASSELPPPTLAAQALGDERHAAATRADAPPTPPPWRA